jgi:hypothetical protein
MLHSSTNDEREIVRSYAHGYQIGYHGDTGMILPPKGLALTKVWLKAIKNGESDAKTGKPFDEVISLPELLEIIEN